MVNAGQSQSGQVVLITILVLAVATTISLSLISRTTTDVNISSQLEDSSRAFSAAEAGIEEALVTGLGTSGTVPGLDGVTYDVANPTDLTVGAGNVFLIPRMTAQGDSETIWFVDYDNDGNELAATPLFESNTMSLCWVSTGAARNAAVAVAVYYRDNPGSVVRVQRMLINTGWTSGTQISGNPLINATNGGVNPCDLGGTSSYVNLDFPTMFNITPGPDILNDDNLIVMRLRPIFAPQTQFAVQAAGLPAQGKEFAGTGTTTSGLTRKIQVKQSFRSAPGIFDYVIYAQNGNFVH